MHHRAMWPDTGGPHAASAMVTHESWAVALEHATDQVLHPGDRPPDLLLLFASPAYGEEYTTLLAAARNRTRAGIVFGCSASGFLAGPHESEDRPGLSLMALWLPGATLVPLRLHQEYLDLLDETAAAGGRMFAQAHSRALSALLSFKTQMPFDRLPVWKDIRSLPMEEQKRKLRDPAFMSGFWRRTAMRLKDAGGPFVEAAE